MQLVLGEIGDLPFLPELPARGAAGVDDRAARWRMVTDLGADLQPAGWRLTDASGIDHRRAKSLLAQDLDTVEELARPGSDAFKVQVPGRGRWRPSVERPRGDKVARRPRRAARPGSGAGRGRAATTSPTYAAASAPPSRRADRRARPAGRAGRRRSRPRVGSAGIARSTTPDAAPAIGWLDRGDRGRRARRPCCTAARQTCRSTVLSQTASSACRVDLDLLGTSDARRARRVDRRGS